METQDIMKSPWIPIPYEAWIGLRTVKDFTGPGTTLYFEDLRNHIQKLLQDLSPYFCISIDRLEVLFWEKNKEWLVIKETDSFYYSRSNSDPFWYPLSCLRFPKPHEETQIAEFKNFFNSLSPVGQAIILRDLNNQKNPKR